MDGCMDYSRARLRRIHLFSWRHGTRHRELRRPEADSLTLCFASQTGPEAAGYGNLQCVHAPLVFQFLAGHEEGFEYDAYNSSLVLTIPPSLAPRLFCAKSSCRSLAVRASPCGRALSNPLLQSDRPASHSHHPSHHQPGQ